MKHGLIKNINNEISIKELSTINKRLGKFVQLVYYFVKSDLNKVLFKKDKNLSLK